MTTSLNSFCVNDLRSKYLLSDTSYFLPAVTPSQNNLYPAQSFPQSLARKGSDMFTLAAFVFAQSGKSLTRSRFVNSGRVDKPLQQNPLTCTPPAEFQALDWLLDPSKTQAFPDRVLARLIQLEAHEPDVWLRDDYRQAQITLILALRGNTEPFTVASYTMYGVHPDKIWDHILENRKARLGRLYSNFYDASGMPKPDVPKKPVTSSGQVSPTTANAREAAGTDTRLEERGISPDSVPSPDPAKEKLA